MDVMIFAGSEIYRQLTVKVPIEGLALEPGVEIEIDRVHARASQADLKTCHEWTTPSATLTIVVNDENQAWVTGKTRLGDPDEPAEWTGTQAKVAGPVTLIRKTADTFRGQFGNDLDDIEAGDFAERLKHPVFDYGSALHEDRADQAHTDAWERQSRSKELRDLAIRGHTLFKHFFPADSSPKLRGYIDSLWPGDRINITWTNRVKGWIPQVPWGLLYMAEPPGPGEPVDAASFMGLRFRISYCAYDPKSPFAELGKLADSHRAHLMYWGSDEKDPIAVEADWQRQQWAPWGNKCSFPMDRTRQVGRTSSFARSTSPVLRR